MFGDHSWCLTRVMWLHALQSVREEASSSEVDRSPLGDDAALDLTPRPESMSHRTPRLLRVRSIVRCPVLADDQTGRGPRKLQIHYALLVGVTLDRVARSVF